MKEMEEALLEMKDTSELMVDLAYSALLYQNRDIAKEVIEMENKIDRLYERILKGGLEKCKEDQEVERYLILIKMADSVERIADAALDIADVVLRDIDLHPVLKKSLEESDTVLVRKVVNKGSFLDGKKIGKAKVASKTGMWIIAVRRGENWSYGPGKSLKLKSGDIIFARGPEESEEMLNRWVGA